MPTDTAVVTSTHGLAPPSMCWLLLVFTCGAQILTTNGTPKDCSAFWVVVHRSPPSLELNNCSSTWPSFSFSGCICLHWCKVLLLKIPYHIIGTKLIFWTWQIDNPVFADKIYGVPWIIFVFDVGSACGFVWWLKFSRAFLLPGFYDWKKFVREFLCSTIAAFGGLLFGIALSILLFSTVQLLRLPMSVAVSAFICLHFIIVYIADRNNKNAESRAGNDYWFDELSLATCIHFIFLMMLILGAQSLNPIVSEGIHQPIGSCKAYSRIELPLGKILERQDFLCLKTLDSDHFNFHCLPGRKPPSVDGNDLLEWYPICGKPMNAEIHAEYIAIIWGICLIAATILYQAAAKSGKTPKIYRVIYQSPNRATKKFN